MKYRVEKLPFLRVHGEVRNVDAPRITPCLVLEDETALTGRIRLGNLTERKPERVVRHLRDSLSRSLSLALFGGSQGKKGSQASTIHAQYVDVDYNLATLSSSVVDMGASSVTPGQTHSLA